MEVASENSSELLYIFHHLLSNSMNLHWRRKRIIWMMSRTESLIVRGQRKCMKVEENVNAHIRNNVPASYLQCFCLTTLDERGEVLLNPTASTSVLPQGQPQHTWGTSSHILLGPECVYGTRTPCRECYDFQFLLLWDASHSGYVNRSH